MKCKDCGGTPCPTCGMCDTINPDCKPSTWQRMETAPTDERTVLLWDTDYCCPLPGFFESTFDDQWKRFGSNEVLNPIAWMPLPKSPET